MPQYKSSFTQNKADKTAIETDTIKKFIMKIKLTKENDQKK
jgi:hypothetical protein